MLSQKSKLALAAVLLVAVGYGAGRYVQPAKVITKTEVQIKEVEVTKKDVKTVVKTVRHKDGTVERVRTTEDKTVTDKNKDSKSTTEKIVESKKFDYRVGVHAALKDGQAKYGLSVERRIFGNIYLGIMTIPGATPIGASISMSF